VSDEDLAVVLEQFDAVNRRDFGRAMELYAEDVVLVVPGSGLKGGRFTGKQPVGDWFGDWFGTWESDYRFEIQEAYEIGDLIFVHAKHGGHGRVSGIEVQGESSYLYRVRDGRVAYVEFHWDRDQALRAARTPERSENETD
jgi:ketosteroid isomerase-like protein